ncbi:MAG: YXWGXW repeat-containing protein [Taibaiella sp.]|nr:YXWGXW repeat-containing protein [Taibaiella sp.]
MERFKKIFLMLALISCAAFQSHAQLIVNLRPARPVYVRTVAPSPRHVWVEEEWENRGGRYEWAGGHWVAPPREGARFVPGHWRRRPGGEVWIPGHWR